MTPKTLIVTINLQKKYRKKKLNYDPVKVYDCGFMKLLYQCTICQMDVV